MLGGLRKASITNMNSQHSGGRWRGWHCVLRRSPSSSTTDSDPVDKPRIIVSISTAATEIYNRLQRFDLQQATEIYNRLQRFTTGYRDLQLVNPPVILMNNNRFYQLLWFPDYNVFLDIMRTPWNFAQRWKKSTNTVLPHTWCNFGGVIASEQNMKDAFVQHKEKCRNMGKGKCARTYTTKKWKCACTYTAILSIILYKHSESLNSKSIHYIIQFRYKIIILRLQKSTCATLHP